MTTKILAHGSGRVHLVRTHLVAPTIGTARAVTACGRDLYGDIVPEDVAVDCGSCRRRVARPIAPRSQTERDALDRRVLFARAADVAHLVAAERHVAAGQYAEGAEANFAAAYAHGVADALAWLAGEKPTANLSRILKLEA